jgi:anthranilate phosphoribosyltransferase
LLNAGAALFVAGRAESVREGIAASAAAVDGGKALEALEALVRVTTEARPA